MSSVIFLFFFFFKKDKPKGHTHFIKTKSFFVDFSKHCNPSGSVCQHLEFKNLASTLNIDDKPELLVIGFCSMFFFFKKKKLSFENGSEKNVGNNGIGSEGR